MSSKQRNNTCQTDSRNAQDQYQNNSQIAEDSQEEKNQQRTIITQELASFQVTQELTSFQDFKNQYSSLNKAIDQQKLQQSNNQGCFTSFETKAPAINEAQLQSFKEFIQELKIKDFTYLSSVWGEELLQQINFILDHWASYKSQYDTCFKDFLNIVNSKIQAIQIYEEFYPQMSASLTKINRKIEERGDKNVVKCYQIKEDIVFYHYLKEQQAKAKKAGSYYLKQQNEERQLLASYIAQNQYYHKNIQTWKRFFFIGGAVNRYSIDVCSDQELKNQCRKIYGFAQQLLQNKQLTQPAKRLCCSKFFYMNFNIAPLGNTNLICRLMNNSLKNKVEKMYNRKVQDKVQVDSFQMQMKELMLDICSLLNHGGGVVLLYTKRMYLEAWVQGETIIEDKKHFYVKLIEKELQAIKPTVKLHRQIFISFVPVVKNPYEYDYLTEVEDEKGRAVNRNYIQGLYVPRLNIVPSQVEKLYYCQVANQKPVTAVYENYERRELRGQDMFLLKKQKEQYFMIEEEDEQIRELLGKDYLYVDRHVCALPYKGHPMYIQQEITVNAKPEKQFKYMSMLIAHKNNHVDIQRKLTGKGIDCMITDIFYNLKLKCSMNSAPLYHNVRFDQILNEVGYNKEFEYNGRYILVVAVSTYIKILSKTNQTNRSDIVSKASLLTLSQHVQKFFPNNCEVLELFRFANEEKEVEYYIKSTSREATLLIYYLMHNDGQKCIFKNPKSLDKIAGQEKEKRWELICSVSTKTK